MFFSQSSNHGFILLSQTGELRRRTDLLILFAPVLLLATIRDPNQCEYVKKLAQSGDFKLPQWLKINLEDDFPSGVHKTINNCSGKSCGPQQPMCYCIYINMDESSWFCSFYYTSFILLMLILIWLLKF